MLSNVVNFILTINKKYIFFLFYFLFLNILSSLSQLSGFYLFSKIGEIFEKKNINDFFYVNYLFENFNYLSFNIFTFFFLIIIFILIFSNTIFIFTNYLCIKIIYSLEFEIREKIINSFLAQSYNKFLSKQTNYLNNAITNETSRFCGGLLIPLTELISRIFLILPIIIYLLIYYTKISILIFLLLILFYFSNYFLIRNKIKDNNLKISFFNKQIFAILNNLINSFIEIKIYNAKNFYIKNISFYFNEVRKIYSFSKFHSTVPRLYLEIILLFLFLIVFIYFQNNNRVEFLYLIPTFIFAFYKISPSIQVIFVQYLITKSNTQSVQNLSSFLKFYKHESNNQISRINNKSQLENVKKIEYKNFSFSYNKENKIINNLNLTLIFPGLIGIVGESGSGKTTVLRLILGLLRSKSGKFFLNNKYIPSSRIMNTLSGTVAYVPQKTIFFEDTIKNNILLNKKFDKKKFNKIINTVDLVKLLNNLPKREETIIHLSNNNLSGGQLQRISLARSLYQDPKLLIIDEGFNQLDSATELKVIENLRKLNLLLIMVYHKLNKKIKLDKVYKIYSGKFKNIK